MKKNTTNTRTKNATAKSAGRPARKRAAPKTSEAAEQAVQEAPVAAPAAAVKATEEPKTRKTSGLDAAVKVLTEAGEPLGCKDMVERMLAQGLWKTGGKTPSATIYAAILREINTKGDASRFRKTDRGRFALAG